MCKEEWRDIKGYEGRYQVSNMGRVKSLERTSIDKRGHKHHTKERIMKQSTDRYGYLLVKLCYRNSKKRFSVHRLVCEAFHENPENKPCVNHIDENKTNNVASNLEWSTYTENTNYGTRNTRVAKALSKTVCQYMIGGKLIKIWQSAHEVERQLGFDQSAISRAARGEQKSAYGYVWKYIEEKDIEKD